MLDQLKAYDFKEVANTKQLANLGMIIQNSFRNSMMNSTHVWLKDPHMYVFHPSNFIWNMPVMQSDNDTFIIKNNILEIDRNIELNTPILIPIGSYYRIERNAIYVATTMQYDSNTLYIVRCFYKEGFTDFQKVFRGIDNKGTLTSL